ADPDGLFVADFDLLARIPGLAAIDIVATESTLASGFHERIREWFPGIDEITSTQASRRPTLIAPPVALPVPGPDVLWWTRRDREEELVDVARRIRGDRPAVELAAAERTAVVFKRPLPYMYLAEEIFGSARIPFRVFDAIPLAAEPTAAALDVILDV